MDAIKYSMEADKYRTDYNWNVHFIVAGGELDGRDEVLHESIQVPHRIQLECAFYCCRW